MKKILYAEDNAGMRKMVSHYLRSIGFEIVAITDGDEAIEIAKVEDFDLILLDVTMERVDGISATKTIRGTQNPNKLKPILGLTGRSEANEIEECMNSGMNLVLSKPVDLEVLAHSIHNILYPDNETECYNEEFEFETPEISPSIKVIDLRVLENYRKTTSAHAVEGLLRDFSDLWPRKIGFLYSSIIKNDMDAFARTTEELAAIAAGIGAGKVASVCSQTTLSGDKNKYLEILENFVNACEEVQAIINGISAPKANEIERLTPIKIIEEEKLENSFEEDFPILRHFG